MIVLQSIRFLVAWAWTMLAAAFAFVPFIPWPHLGWIITARPWARVALWLIGVRLEIEGEENLRGPAVFVSNHQSLIDVVFLPAILPRTVKFVAKKELIRVPFWGWALANGGGLMIDRKDPRGAIAAIREGLRRMPEGWSVAVFPEGTRSKDGRIGVFKKGAWHIAMERHLPIVPIGLEGARDAIPKGAWFVRPARVFVHVGAPIPTDAYRLETIDRHVADGREAVIACHARAVARHRAFHGRERVSLAEELRV